MGTTPGYVVILLFLGKALHVALAKTDGKTANRYCETEGVSEDQKRQKKKHTTQFFLKKGKRELAPAPVLIRSLLCWCKGKLSLIKNWHRSSVAPCSRGIRCVSKCSKLPSTEFCWNLDLLSARGTKNQ